MDAASSQPMEITCDNQTGKYIANNSVFHVWMKHICVDCHYIHDMVIAKWIVTSYLSSGAQLGDILLFFKTFLTLCDKLSMIDIYTPAWEGVLEREY